MARRLPRTLFWAFPSSLVLSVTWRGPSSTARNRHSVTSASRTTKTAPVGTPVTKIDTPSTYEPPHVCGYIDYDSHDSYTCASHNTCLWNSKLKLVGCGNPTSINYITSCIPYRDLLDCDGNCFANPSIIQCGSDLPHCATPRVGPKSRYSILQCQATHSKVPFDVYLEYEGQTTTGHLPRWLGDDGNITYATRIPHFLIRTAETDGVVFQETQTLYSTLESGGVVLLTKSVSGDATRGTVVIGKETQSCAPNVDQESYVQQQKQKEIVAGSIIGSAMLLVILIFLVGVLVSWRRKVRREERGERR